jgi:hypothetical protein
MESKKKIRKAALPSSSSDDSSSSDSADARRKQKHRRKQRGSDSSSSSEEEVVHKHKHQHKKSSSRKHSHSSKMRSRMLAANTKEKIRGVSPSSRTAHKHHSKTKLVKKSKLIEEHERRRDVMKERTPEHRITSPTTRIRVSIPNNRVQDVRRSIKDSPSTSRRHVLREAPDDRSEHISRQKQLRRMQEEEHYKYKGERSSRMTPEKHHQHERSRSHSHGRVPIRERLDKADYDYPREVSREREFSPMIRAPPGSSRGEPIERPYEPYRGEERRHPPPHEYGSGPSSSRIYDDRHHRPNWDDVREPEHPRSRGYEGIGGGNREWEHSHERKRPLLDEPHYKERPWSEHRGDKGEPKEWSRGGGEVSSWKERGPPNPMAPTMPHPRRWPGPSSDSWAPRGSHPPNKHDSHPSSSGGPPFKPRGSPYFGGFNRGRFPFKRFPNQYTKINYPSKRVIPSASETAAAAAAEGNKTDPAVDNVAKPSTPSSNDQESVTKSDVLESGEIASEMEEEEKVAQQPDTTFSGNAEAAEECEGNLSEFSDVDDDILNREEVSN